MLTLKYVNNKEFIKRYARSIANILGDGSAYKSKELACWAMYYSKLKKKDYDYLTRYGSYDVPAQVRFTSIVRPNIDYLVSNYLSNNFNFSVKTVDRKSLNSKYEDKIKEFAKRNSEAIYERYSTIESNIQMLLDKEQELMVMLDQEPQNEQHAAQLEELRNQMPIIRLKIDQMSKSLERELKDQFKKLDRSTMLENITVTDLKEHLAYKKLLQLFEDKNISNVHKNTMTEKYVTGRPAIYVDIVNNELEYKWIPSYSVFIPKDTTNTNAEEGVWAAYEEYWSYQKVINRFGNELSGEDVKQLRINAGMNEEYKNDSQLGASDYISGKLPTFTKNNIRVLHLFFQLTAEIPIVKSKSVDGSITHVHISTDKEKIKEGKEIENRYKTYVYEAYIVNNNIIVGCRLRKHQVIKVDNLGWNQLPIITDSFDDASRSPYSLIWATRDLQALYQIIEYYEELLYVISGVKGYVMDISQMPESMDQTEWMYFRKMGTIFIETVKKDRRVNSTFNQFQTFDDTIPATIQYLGNAKDRIMARVDNITGVTRLARGEMNERDAVGNSKLSMQATNKIADVQYWEHDNLIRRALSRLLNLYGKNISKEGDVFNLFNKDTGDSETVNIPKELLNAADFECVIMNNNKNQREIEEIRSVIGAEYQRGNMDMLGMIKTFQATSVTELRLIAEQMAKQAQEMQQNMAANQGEAEKELLQFENQLAVNLKQNDWMLKEMENKLKELDIMTREKIADANNTIQREKIASDNFIKTLDIVTKAETENNRLEAEKASVQVDQILKQMEIVTQAALGEQKNLIDDKKLDTKVNKE